MAMAEEIAVLRDRALAELVEAHDYYSHTKLAWETLIQVVAAGRTLSVRNLATGTLSTEADLVDKSRGYIARQLAEATFQQFLSIFEIFLFDLLRLWLMAYPRSLVKRQVQFEDILDAPDKEAITTLVVNKELSEVFYDRPAAWFAYLESKASLGCPTPAEIEAITEAKASRDALVHNRGYANKTYRAKAGKLARYQAGQRIDIPRAVSSRVLAARPQDDFRHLACCHREGFLTSRIGKSYSVRPRS